jgi:O-antigen ligase
MEYRLALFFLFLYYIRPQDWVAGWSGFNIIKPLMLAWLAALFTSRSRSPLPGLLRTPHDWCILAYYGYVVWNAPDTRAALTGFLPLAVFYALTVQSLVSWERVAGYLKMWNLMLLGVATLAVGSLYGIDLTGAQDMTTKNAGRLAIGTWLHNNPNSLAHTVIVALPLSYLAWFWKGGGAGRLLAFPAGATLACLCAYHASSKGAYLVAGGLVVLIFVIGRPLGVKLLAVAVAGTVGLSALSFLPRMSGMANLSSNEGVQGRLMAWELAKTVFDTSPTGVGWKQFVPWVSWEGETFVKATHSSYVQIGADLGQYGLFLYIAGLWLALRGLTFTAPRFTTGERGREFSRRAALILVLAYVVSNWMINREYHTEYFLMIAVAGALHRLCLTDPATAATPEAPRPWLHPDWRDFAVAGGLTWAVAEAWSYMLVSL